MLLLLPQLKLQNFLHCQKVLLARPSVQALNEAPSTWSRSNTATQQQPSQAAQAVEVTQNVGRRLQERTSTSQKDANEQLCGQCSLTLPLATPKDLDCLACEPIKREVTLLNHACFLSLSYDERYASTNIESSACAPPCSSMFLEKTWGHELCSRDRSFPSPGLLCSSYRKTNKTLEDDRIESSPYIVIHCSESKGAPCILLTAPPLNELYTSFAVSMHCRVPIQSSSLLLVPPLYLSTCRMPNYAEWCAWIRQPMPTAPVPCFRRPVFKLSHFGRIVKRGECERQCPFFQHIVPAVTKHTFKTVALAASLYALEIRGRYAADGYVETFERPFCWTDPAEPLICHLLKAEVLHIRPPNPFSSPHILVEFAFENDSHIMQGNTAPSKQCLNDLTVLQRTAAVPCGDVDEEGDDYESFDEDSVEPSTPTGIRRIGRCFFGRGDDNEPTVIDVQDYVQVQSQPSYTPNATTCRNEVKAKFFIDEDEDDGPPEYDDWFLSIAQRTQAQFF